MSSRRREQRAWYVYDWANSAFSTTVVTALFGPYLTELVRVAAAPNGRVELLGIAVDYRAVWEWLMALSVATHRYRRARPYVGHHGQEPVIPLALLRSRPGKNLPAGQGYLITGIRQLRHTLTKARRLPDTLIFLVAYLVYNDGIQTVIVLAGQFAVVELKLGYASVLGSFLLTQVVGIPGAISFQRIAGYIGNKRAVMLALAVWTLTMLYVFAGVTTKEEFFLLSAVIGFVMGGSQALSRSIFSFLIPKGEEAEYFSLYEVSDKGSSLVGPAVLASVVDATGSFRLGALALAVFFVAGSGILSRVDVGRGAVAVGNEAPPADFWPHFPAKPAARSMRERR